MKKVLKYLGIAIAVIIGLFVILMIVGLLGSSKDKKVVESLTSDSIGYYENVGTYENFCNSDLYLNVQKHFGEKITCDRDSENEGNGLQIAINTPYALWGCKIANRPPKEGKIQKSIACVQLPDVMRGAL